MNNRAFEKLINSNNIFKLEYEYSNFLIISILIEKTIFNMKLKNLHYRTYNNVIIDKLKSLNNKVGIKSGINNKRMITQIKFEGMYDVNLEILPFNNIIYSFKLELNKIQHPITSYINGIYDKYNIWSDEFVNIRLFKFNNKVLKL